MFQQLYKIKNNYVNALDNLSMEDQIDYQSINDTLEAIQDEFKEKAVNLASYIKNIDLDLNKINEYEKSISKRKKELESKKEGLIKYLKQNMLESEIKNIESAEFKISLRKSPSAIQVYNESIIPEDYFRVEENKVLDKKKMKQAISEGAKIDGVHLFQDSYVFIG